MSDAVNQRASQRSTHLGKYFLLDLVHAGSTAEILKAKTVGIEGFERILAIKRLLPDVSKDRALVARLLEEARTAGKLQHENIVQVLDVGKNENDYFVALEFVEGRDLRSIREVIREQGQRMPTSLTCYLVMQLCDGLDFVHSSCDARGRSLHLVHGDVSPHHVLVSYEGEVKLTGFGSIDAASQTARPP